MFSYAPFAYACWLLPPLPEQQYDDCSVFAVFAAMTACQAFYLLRGLYLARTKCLSKPTSSHQLYVLYSVLSQARRPISSFLQPCFWETALPAALTVFLLIPPLPINLIASPMDSLFLTSTAYSAHPDDPWVQPTWASHTPPERHYYINPSWQWHSRRSFGTCIFHPPQASHQYAWGDSSWPLRLHPASGRSASMPTCNMSSSGTNIEQQLIASDLPKPKRLQSKALVAVSEALVSDSKALVSVSEALLSDLEALVSDSKACAASVSDVCMLRPVTLSQHSVLSGHVDTACAVHPWPLAVSSADDVLNHPFQAASISKAHYTAFKEQHAAAPGIKVLKASESAVDTAANSLILSCMSSVFQMPDIVCTASAAAAAGTAAALLASEVTPSIMEVMPANSAMQATMVTGVVDSIFIWADVTNTTLAIVQYAAPALHHHTLPAVCAALSPALVLPTITDGLHSMIIHGGEHDDHLSGRRMSK